MPFETTTRWVLSDGAISIATSACSDRGKVRRINEDSFAVAAPVFVVADGMGGHAHGDRASQTAVGTLVQGISGDEPTSSARVITAFAEANDAVRSISSEFAGTTVAGVALVGDGSDQHYWMAFNIGDSRVYLWGEDGLRQLSVDHSAVQELLDEGAIEPEDVRTHPDRNVVTRAIGLEAVPEPDVSLIPAVGHQTFVLCSDGLTKELDDEEIAEVLRQPNSDPAADRLVAAALASGGGDNVTVLVVESVRAGEDDRAGAAGVAHHLEDTLPRGGDRHG